MALEVKRPPDESGPAGRAWLSRLSDAQIAAFPAGLDTWVLEIPGAAVAWSSYSISSISLRDLPGVAPATRSSPEMTHELFVWSLCDRDFRVDPDNVYTLGPARLAPANYGRQFHVRSDAEACGLVRSLVRAFLSGALPIEPHVFVEVDGKLVTKTPGIETSHGVLTPQRLVHGSIDATAKCIREGHHAPH